MLLSALAAVIFTLYIEALLALVLHNSYNLPDAWIGVFFLLSAGTYVIAAPLSSLLTKYSSRRTVILISFILMIVQNACLGPSSLLGLPDSLILVTIGTLFVGLNVCSAMVPILSELIEILKDLQKYDPSQISDMSAALFNSMFNLGNLLAPLIAGALYDAKGYKFATDTMMISATVYTIFFIFFMRSS